jgi:hypothetical protein
VSRVASFGALLSVEVGGRLTVMSAAQELGIRSLLVGRGGEREGERRFGRPFVGLSRYLCVDYVDAVVFVTWSIKDGEAESLFGP